MEKIISGIQQMGIGIPNVHEAWTWYRKHFGMDIPVFEEAASAGLMTKYTGNKVQDRHAILALSMQGGGGFEIWQYTSKTPQAPENEVTLGDLGFFACKMKTLDADKAFENFDKKYLLSRTVNLAPNGTKHFFVKDQYENIFQVIESNDIFSNTKHTIGGVFGAIIGVSDMDKAKSFYSNILGYDTVLSDSTSTFEDFLGLSNSDKEYRRVILTHSEKHGGAFSPLLGTSQIELVQDTNEVRTPIFKDRMWGDLGFIHLCFDVISMEKLKQNCATYNIHFTVDSANTFDMGEAAGHFSYIEDPDGTLIEFVETHKIPMMKKIGWYLDLTKRNQQKPLPRILLKGLGLNRKK